MIFQNSVVKIKRLISSCHTKLFQRFFAVALALFFVGFGPSFVAPVPALNTPDPVLKTLIDEQGTELVEPVLKTLTEQPEVSELLLEGLADPIVLVVGVVALVGVAWYYYSQEQQQAAQELAKQKYCAAYPNDSVCAGQMPGVSYDLQGTFVNNSAFAPGGCGTTWTWHANGLPGPINQQNFTYGGFNLGYWGYYAYGLKFGIIQDATNFSIGGTASSDCFGGSGNYHTNYLKITSVVRSDGQPDTGGTLDWKDWPADKRHAAVQMLTTDDWRSNLQQSLKGGALKPNDKLPRGYYSYPPDGSAPSYNPGPVTAAKPGKPYKFPSPLDKELTQRQKVRLMERVRVGKLTNDDINNGYVKDIEDDPDKKKCFYIHLSTHLGNYEAHSQYATQVTGSPGDFFVMTSDPANLGGPNYAYYDGELTENGTAAKYGLESAGAVAEVKTDQGWLIKVADNSPLTESEEEDNLDLDTQLYYQSKVAQACKLSYFIAFAKQDVATIAGPMLEEDYPPASVYYIPFDQPSSSAPSTAKTLTAKLTPPRTNAPIAQQSAKGKLVAAMKALFNRSHDNNHSKLADNQFVSEGQSSPSKTFQLSKSTPTGENRTPETMNNDELEGKYSERTLSEYEVRNRLSQPIALRPSL
jgi:hypothetical protein